MEELQRLHHLKSHSRIATRLRVILLAREGRTAGQVAAATGLSRRPVQQWVRRYNDEGVGGLWDRPRSGKPTHLPRDQAPAAVQPRGGVVRVKSTIRHVPSVPGEPKTPEVGETPEAREIP